MTDYCQIVHAECGATELPKRMAGGNERDSVFETFNFRPFLNIIYLLIVFNPFHVGFFFWPGDPAQTLAQNGYEIQKIQR